MSILTRIRYKSAIIISPEVRKELANRPVNELDAEGFDDEQMEIIKLVRPYTMTSSRRIAQLVDAVRYVVLNKIPGDFVECGVWRGGSMMAIAHTLKILGDNSRTLYLFDTFEGMPPPTEHDVSTRLNVPAATLLATSFKDENDPIWAYSPLEAVRANIAGISYPDDKVVFVKGLVEETIPEAAPREIAILRLDTDWYESTKHELDHLYDRVAQLGVVVFDDYGWWNGAKRAVDEFFEAQPFRPMLNRIDETGRFVIKP